ncbi:hypothetical protein [Peteryoungia ipomoeae]|uniref:Uncharacterized protein n=1 Tax=Peteryoungia ipomoeae TaxID=1210932 RepID=A0A4S8NWS3_9HYPH|nr:hypothetical protein [Peteryoungia ipomoeae]THV21321.1 hypothetical protein FAA97_14950 [Peteryoungia ipomoeae]
MVELIKRLFGKNIPSTDIDATLSPQEREEAQRAARRAQVISDLIELQRIATAELALRQKQDAEAGIEGQAPFGQRIAII